MLNSGGSLLGKKKSPFQVVPGPNSLRTHALLQTVKTIRRHIQQILAVLYLSTSMWIRVLKLEKCQFKVDLEEIQNMRLIRD